MRTHLAGVHLRTGAATWSNATEVVTAASVIKLPVMVHVLRAVDAGTLAFDDVAPLVHPMIAVSSNDATNQLLDVVGIAAVQRTVGSVGLASTHLRRRMMDLEARAAGRENVTTAADVVVLLRALVAGSLLSAPMTAFAMACLHDQEFPALPVPPGHRFAHKTGELAGVRHDAGILLDGADAPTAVVVALLSELDLDDDDETPADLFHDAAEALSAGLTPRRA